MTSQGLGCGMCDLVPWPQIEPRLPALGAWSLGHWTAAEAPVMLLLRAHWVPLQNKLVSWLQPPAFLRPLSLLSSLRCE